MSNNKVGVGVSKNLPEVTDRAIRAIVALTGENAEALAKKTPDEIFQFLSFLLHCKKEALIKLLVEHDQNQELDIVSLLKMWKLVNKGKVHGKKREFKGLDDELYRYLKFFSAQKGDKARYDVDNHLLGSTSADVEMKKSVFPVVMGNIKSILDKLSYAKVANSNHVEAVDRR